MQKTKTKLLTALLLSLFAVAMMPFAANASTGFIRINSTTQSTVGQQVQAGGNVNLYFGGVTFSGGQFNLFIGPTGFSQISTGATADVQYTPTFDISVLYAPVVTPVAGTTQYPGSWNIGFGWINGTIKQDLPGGNFFIKAFDGTSTSVAVTDTYVTIIGNIFINPTSGGAGQSLTLNGYAFIANSLVNVTYSSISLGANNNLALLLQTGPLGNFSLTFPAPDTKVNLAAGLQSVTPEIISFVAVQNSTLQLYNATYTENARGLTQARVTGTGGSSMTIGAGQVLGNNTVLTLTGVGVQKTLRFAGNYFYPGALITRFDNGAITNAAPTVNGTGWFNTTITIPPTTNGVHNITFIDSNNVVFTVFFTVVPSLILSTPTGTTSGPVGTVVTATGYGFTAPTATVVNNASLTWNLLPIYIGSTFVDATGTFTTTFVVPTSLGGSNVVTAWENASGTFLNITTASFTVTASFIVTPNTFENNGSTITASGTGFKPGSLYFPNIDNQMLGMGQLTNPATQNWQTGVQPDVNGTISIKFVGAGFQAGTHVVSLYENGTTAPAAGASALFTVTGDPAVSEIGLLTQINQTTIQTNSTVNSISTNVNALNTTIGNVNANINALNTTINTMNTRILAINGTVVTLQTSMGAVTTSISTLSTSITSITGNIATLQTSMGTVTTTVNSLSASITSINNGVATIQTTLGTINTKLDTLDAVLGAVAGQTATLSTSLGTITTSLTSIGTTVTALSGDLASLKTGDLATIKTDLGTLQGTVTSNANGIATIQTTLGTIQTNVGSLQTDVTSTKSSTDNLSPLVIVAIVLALIAAIAAIASIVMMRRKIAG